MLQINDLYFLIPAYVSHLIFHKIVVTKKTQGHEYVLQIGCWALAAHFAGQELSVLAVLLLLPALAFISAKIWKGILPSLPDYVRFSEHYFQALEPMRNNTVQITLKNGKVYVGDLLSFTDDPNDPKRLLVLIPRYSGYRDTEKRLILNNSYTSSREKMKSSLEGKSEAEMQECLRSLEIVIWESEIASVSRFSADVYDAVQGQQVGVKSAGTSQS